MKSTSRTIGILFPASRASFTAKWGMFISCKTTRCSTAYLTIVVLLSLWNVLWSLRNIFWSLGNVIPFPLRQVFLGLCHGHKIRLAVSTECLTHCNDEIPSTGDWSDSFSIKMGHYLWCAFNYSVSRSKLTHVVLTPTVQESLFCQCDTETITNSNHICLTSYLLNSVWC